MPSIIIVILGSMYKINGDAAGRRYEYHWRIVYADAPLSHDMLVEGLEIWYRELMQ